MSDYITTRVDSQYHSHIPYAMQNYLTYARLRPHYQHYLAAFTSVAEPRTFSEASQDPHWVEVMKVEI